MPESKPIIPPMASDSGIFDGLKSFGSVFFKKEKTDYGNE
jgi:hypothetical protein